MSKLKDLTGQKFGRLTVLNKTEKRVAKCVIWKCLCECGNICEVSSKNLTGKNGLCTQSCGCLFKEAHARRTKDLLGMRFGNLVAVEKANYKVDRKTVWKCHCDCGNVSNVQCDNLLNGHTRSCGCLFEEYSEKREQLEYVDGTQITSIKSNTISKRNKTGVRGVTFNAKGKYVAKIVFKRKTYNLGTYIKLEDAAKARKVAEEKIYGEFLEWYYETYPERKNGFE